MTFDLDLANTLIDLNEAAYALSYGKPCILPAGFSAPVPIVMDHDRLPYVLRGDTRSIWGFTAMCGEQEYIVFRGTEDIQEWVADAYGLPMYTWNTSGAKVHRGFYEIYEALCPSLRIMTTTPIVSCHSLGSAIGSMCYVDLKYVQGFKPWLVRFASPRVGNAAFSALLDGTLRIMNKEDIVPQLPKAFGFADGGTLITVHGPGSIFDRKLAHSLESYRSGLNALPHVPGI